MIIPFGEFKPDQSDLRAETTQRADNVLPRADGYGPAKSLNTVSSPLAEGNDTFTKALLQFPGADASTTITDSNTGGSAHTWTPRGNAQIDTADYKFGGSSLLLDGTGDYVDTPDHADFTLGSGDFTIDLWFKCNVAGGTFKYIAGQCDSAGFGNADSAWGIRRDDTNVISAHVVQGTTVTDIVGTTQFTNAVNTGWHHIAFVRTGNTLKLFIDGIQEGGNISFSGAVNNSTDLLGVGSLGGFVTTPWLGWLDEFRISVGIARWITTFTPPAKPYDTVANGVCRGEFYARKASDGSIVVFAATATRLFRLDNTSFQWVDVSKGSIAYSTVTTDDQWQFVQYGDTVLATQSNTVVQRYDLASSTEFANLAGSPPQAKYIAIVLTFVVLSGLASDPLAIVWSGNGIITTWTPGVSESDEQSFADGGQVRGVAGGQFGIICQSGALKRMVYVPGNALTFQFDRISEDHGILAPYSLVRGGDQFFFFGTQGFQKIGGTGYPIPIGKEKFDRTTLADLDTASLRLFIGASDPRATRVYWSYKSLAGQAGLFDKIIVYDYALERGCTLIVSGEYIASLTKPGLTLENLDSISGSIDDLPFSLDDVSTTALSALSGFSSDHKLGFFDGENLEATIEIPEQGDETQRVRVKGIRPISDAATIYGSVSRRETLQATRTQTTETLVNAYGISSQRDITTRYARARVRIPAGETWTFATGIEPLVKAVGSR